MFVCFFSSSFIPSPSYYLIITPLQPPSLLSSPPLSWEMAGSHYGRLGHCSGTHLIKNNLRQYYLTCPPYLDWVYNQTILCTQNRITLQYFISNSVFTKEKDLDLRTIYEIHNRSSLCCILHYFIAKHDLTVWSKRNNKLSILLVWHKITIFIQYLHRLAQIGSTPLRLLKIQQEFGKSMCT